MLFADGQSNGPFTPILPSSASYTNDYDVRMTGFLSVPTTGTYYLRTGSDDGSMIWLDSSGTEVVNNNWYQGTTWRAAAPFR